MDSFSSRVSKILEGTDPPESMISLCSDVRTPLELQLIELLKLNIKPYIHSEYTKKKQIICEKLLALKSINVVFINDNGFYAGAGIATARQACSFALAGHNVSVIGLNPYPETALGRQRYNSWIQQAGERSGKIRYYASSLADSELGRNGDKDHTLFIEKILEKERCDLVVLGNFHSDAISFRFLDPILKRRLPVIWYAHDLDLMGGGCGYPQYYNCCNYETGCLDSNCPRPVTEYPLSANGRVERTYALRSILHEYSDIFVACNSRWSLSYLTTRYPRNPILRIPYGIDTTVFYPTADRSALRKKLGIHPTKFTVVVGADSVGRPGKGGEILDKMIPAILEDEDCQILAFGDYPNKPSGVCTTGYLDDEASISQVFASGDCFLNPVTIEAFGQTILEASACGCVPVVLKEGGGVLDAVEDGRTGLVASSPEGLLSTVKRLKDNKQLLSYLAKEGQERVHQKFSLERQYCEWVRTLTSVWTKPKKQEIHQPLDSILPMVSVVSATLNCEESIRTTASSLAMQDFHSFEWIIQDGGSTDQTLEIARTSGVPCSIYQGKDSGIYDALNKAISRCRGDWVLFLHAGDWLAGPESLRKVMSSINIAGTDLIVANYVDILIDGTIVPRSPANPLEKLQVLRDGSFNNAGPHWLSGMPCHQGILTRRTWLERFPFDPNIPISADWFQMLSIIDAGAKVTMCDQVLSWYPNGGYSYEHSDQWMTDIIKIAKYFADDHGAVDRYFSEALDEHQQKCLERRHRRHALKEFHRTI